MGLEFDLDELVAEFAASGTCLEHSQLMELGKYFKMNFKKIVELPFNSNFKLKFSCSSIEMNIILLIIKIVIIVY